MTSIFISFITITITPLSMSSHLLIPTIMIPLSPSASSTKYYSQSDCNNRIFIAFVRIHKRHIYV